MLNVVPSNNPDAIIRHAAALAAKNQLDHALASYQQLLSFQPDHPIALSCSAMLLLRLNRPADAVAALQKAVAAHPNMAPLHINLGLALIANRQSAAAVDPLRAALKLDPGNNTAWNNLGLAQLELHHFDDAAATFRRALGLPAPPDVALLQRTNLSIALIGAGQPHLAIDAIRDALTANPNNLPLRSASLLCLHYLTDISPDQLFHEHQRFGQAAAAAITPLPPITPVPPGNRPLHIGYLSPDFRDHAVARFILPILANHDSAHFHITCYSTAPADDALTPPFQSLVHRWRTLTHTPDAAAAQIIREDRIDILVNLAGHTAGNRLTLFALKPAPIQLTWLGYPNTTGLSTIDFRLTDDIADPPSVCHAQGRAPEHARHSGLSPITAQSGAPSLSQNSSDARSTECLLRLPHAFLCYQPPDAAPDVSPLPALTNHHITFGTFNALPKINDPLLDLWAKLLQAIPTARLLLKNAAFSAQPPIDRLRAAFTARNIDPARLTLLPYAAAHTDHLAAYSQIDIALDTSPYNGTTTTCDALWMGVPVITLPGQTHHSRVGASLLTAARLTYLIADNEPHFLRLAADLASDPQALAATRSRLRNYIAGTPLFDPKPFTKNLEQTYLSLMKQRSTT